MVDIKNISFPVPHVTPDAVTKNIFPVYVSISPQEIKPQTDSPLFKLSAEIRQQIYEYVFQTEPNQGKKFPLRRSWRRPGVEGRPHIHTNLLRTCKLIYVEGWAIPTLNTTMIIHEGSEVDRMPGKTNATVSHPSQLLLGLPAWQVLLLQHVQITLSQHQLENGVMEAWLTTLHKARCSAAYYVQRFIKQKCFDTPLLQDFAKAGLMNTKIQDLTVRLNRQDWWCWSFDPIEPPKAKDEMFEAPGPEGEDSPEEKTSFMVWDGQVRKESWERGKTDHGIWWMQKKGMEDDGRKIETRYIRFVQERFVEPANNPRKRKWTRPPRIAQF
ncbi:unnamed protein product [Clonostachys solani]|uniref:Uncharacterized protein n=1 Tax=Clonostachys solani TaxID=160281 RepID=A0A9N9YW72_9HYPO|nr:unnamed protein product [Clonostachys solani]